MLACWVLQQMHPISKHHWEAFNEQASRACGDRMTQNQLQLLQLCSEHCGACSWMQQHAAGWHCIVSGCCQDSWLSSWDVIQMRLAATSRA